MLNPTAILYYGNKGLSELLGTKNNRRLQSYKTFSYIYNGKKFPKFPAHKDILSDKPQSFYIRSEVEQWLRDFATLSDDIAAYGEPRRSIGLFKKTKP